MSVAGPGRPDLAAHREATAAPFAALVRELTAAIGKKLTSHIAGVKDARALDRWIKGAAPYNNAEERLRLAFLLVRMLQSHQTPAVIQAWLTGLNPDLNDRAPIRLLREEDLATAGPELLAAARAFIAGS